MISPKGYEQSALSQGTLTLTARPEEYESTSAGVDVAPEPSCEACLIEISGCQGEDDRHASTGYAPRSPSRRLPPEGIAVLCSPMFLSCGRSVPKALRRATYRGRDLTQPSSVGRFLDRLSGAAGHHYLSWGLDEPG